MVEEKDDEDGRPGDARLLTQCDEEEIMFTFASGAAVSAMPRTCSQRAGPENKFHRVATGSKIPDLGGKKITSKSKNRFRAIGDLSDLRT